MKRTDKTNHKILYIGKRGLRFALEWAERAGEMRLGLILSFDIENENCADVSVGRYQLTDPLDRYLHNFEGSTFAFVFDGRVRNFIDPFVIHIDNIFGSPMASIKSIKGADDAEFVLNVS